MRNAIRICVLGVAMALATSCTVGEVAPEEEPTKEELFEQWYDEEAPYSLGCSLRAFHAFEKCWHGGYGDGCFCYEEFCDDMPQCH